MDLKSTYNKIAEDWHKDHAKDTWWVTGMRSFVDRLPASGSVLDIGCAGGVKSKHLADLGFSVLGIDLSERFIEIAKREVPQARFQVLDLKEVGKLPDTFDGICLLAVLLHIPKAEAGEVVAKIAEKLTPGGHLYIAVKEKREDGPEEEEVVENDYGYPYQRFFSYYTFDELRQFFTDAGLEIVFEDAIQFNRTNWLYIIGQKSRVE